MSEELKSKKAKRKLDMSGDKSDKEEKASADPEGAAPAKKEKKEKKDKKRKAPDAAEEPELEVVGDDVVEDDMEEDEAPKKEKKPKKSKEEKKAAWEERSKVAPAVHKSQISTTPFTSLALSEPIQSAITAVRKQEFLTTVQEAVLPLVLGKSQDVVLQAKPATGRTLTFLISVLEGMAKTHTLKGGQASALIITSNMARSKHIQTELESLSKFQSYPFAVLAGAQSVDRDRKRLSKPCDIIIATPERIIEHMQRTAKFIDKIDEAKFIVIDNCDTLLDNGLKGDLEMVLSQMHQENRQTMLVSSTPSDAVRAFAEANTRPDRKVVEIFPEGETQVRKGVRQEYFLTDPKDQPLALLSLLNQLQNKKEQRTVVYFPTAEHAEHMSRLIQKCGVKVLDIHNSVYNDVERENRKAFDEAKKAVVFTIDPTARKSGSKFVRPWLDAERITTVVQVGIPVNVQRYVQRLGEGKIPKGVLLLSHFEEKAAKEFVDYGVERTATPIPTPVEQRKIATACQELALAGADQQTKQKADAFWQSWLGYYVSQKPRLQVSIFMLVKAGNELLGQMFNDPEKKAPAMHENVANRMGVRSAPELNLVAKSTRVWPPNKEAEAEQKEAEKVKAKSDLEELVKKLKAGAAATKVRPEGKQRKRRRTIAQAKGEADYQKGL